MDLEGLVGKEKEGGVGMAVVARGWEGERAAVERERAGAARGLGAETEVTGGAGAAAMATAEAGRVGAARATAAVARVTGCKRIGTPRCVGPGAGVGAVGYAQTIPANNYAPMHNPAQACSNTAAFCSVGCNQTHVFEPHSLPAALQERGKLLHVSGTLW